MNNIENNDFKIIYICKNKYHLIMLLWSLESLKRYNFENITIIVSNYNEKVFLKDNFSNNLDIKIIDVDINKYPKFSYKPFVLKEIINNKIDLANNTIISDADIIWKKDPKLLFKRIKNKNWFHKITIFNDKDYSIDYKNIKPSNIGLKTIKNYFKENTVKNLPNFIVNAGLFSLNKKIFYEVINNWFKKIKSLDPEKMLMSEALLSLTLSELNIPPYCDKENMKYYEKNINSINFSSKILENHNELTGYEIVEHYFGKKRFNIVKEILFKNNYSKKYILQFVFLHYYQLVLKRFSKLVM